MKKHLFIFILVSFVVASSESKAQTKFFNPFGTAVGGRFYPGALSIKQYVFNQNAFELNGYYWNGGRVTLLYEVNRKIVGLKGLSWYVGPGVHISFYDGKDLQGTLMGLDAVVGLDLKMKAIPFDFSLDWQPSYDFGGGANFSGLWGGLGIRYFIK